VPSPTRARIISNFSVSVSIRCINIPLSLPKKSESRLKPCSPRAGLSLRGGYSRQLTFTGALSAALKRSAAALNNSHFEFSSGEES